MPSRNVKENLLVELSHVPMGVIAVFAGWARWLELRLAGEEPCDPVVDLAVLFCADWRGAAELSGDVASGQFRLVRMKILSRSIAAWFSVLSFAFVPGACMSASAQSGGTQFSISFSKQRSQKPLDGRMLLLLSTDPSEEPRMQINDTPKTQMVFGIDVDGLKPEQAVTVDASSWGYPIRSLRDVPVGEYYVQAVLQKYETFHRSDGKTVKLPMDQGEGRHWNIAPGNLYSKPVKMTLGKSGAPVKIVLDQEIPPIPVPGRHQVRAAHQNPERVADEILGTAHVSFRGGTGAVGIR